jgi:starch synthase
MVSRLADQKGFDLLAEALPALMGRDLQLVILGTGEERYHRLLGEMAQIYPGQLAVRVGFDDGLARQIYGGGDLFLMPSRYEPCGLGQLISLRYGTIPAVRKTGGLADTVEEFQPASGTGTGFVFEAYVPEALVAAVDRAIGLFRQDAQWQGLVQNAMAADFSWEASARQYVDLFDRAVGRARHWETGGVNEKG